MSAKAWLATTGVCLWAAAASAQVPTGTIAGRVVDQSGGAVPGATVTATSPNLQGERTVVTSAYGDYAIPLLPPGDYTVTVELTGFQTVKRQTSVAATQTVSIDVSLTVGGVQEDVTVIATASPFLETATNATSVRQALTEALPTSRTLVAAVLLAPNVHATGPNNNNGADGSIAIGGAMSFDSLYLLNGVQITENVRGQPYTLFIEDAIQETTVATSGISAEYGRFGGGVVNAITKSGGNTFSGSYRQSFNNDSWRTLTPFEAALAEPARTNARLHKTVPTYEYTVGGPVVKDRLWFFTAGRLQNQQQNRTTTATNIPYTFTNDEKRYEGKLTYSLNNSHTVRGTYTKIQQDLTNNTFGTPLDLRTLYDQGQPQDLVSLNYNGIFGARLAIEGQYSSRHFSFEDKGDNFRPELGQGTLLIDRARGGTGFRYWAPTFCSCLVDDRDNSEALVKATYFTSTSRFGSHSIVFGFDSFNDHRLANNYQSNTNYRVLGTSTIVRGTDIYPVFLGDGSTLIQWDPLNVLSEGTDLRTNSAFANDLWRWSQVTLSLGLRFDRNDAVDAAGGKISNSSRWSPRLGVTWDPTKRGVWSISGSFARYASALATAVAENSPAGNPATYQFTYSGPSVNADASAPLVTPDTAIQTVFNWFNANGGTNRPFSSANIPGVNVFINDSLQSPYALEYAGGLSRTLGSRGSMRFDYVYRDFHDFYAQRTDLTTGRVTNSAGQTFDISLVENTDNLKRRYQSGTWQITYRALSSLNVGGAYTLSRLWGNIDGENPASGPLTARLEDYPEYRQASWNLPEGNLFGDQRNRARIWGTYNVPLGARAGALDLSLLFGAASGVPYGLNSATTSAPGLTVGQVDPRPYVVNPGYANPLQSTTTVDYFFFARDRYRTEAQYRTDFSANYKHRLAGRAEAFVHMEVLNIFNQFQLCGCGGTVFNNGGGSDVRQINTGVQTRATAGAASGLVVFNPFTETPVDGVNWRLAPNFGTAASRYAFTSPPTFRFNVGVRF
jgi:outer membrane receptor for ferrienterochelin and colicin